MTPEDLQELIGVADARRQQAEAEMARICRREAELRHLLQDMADQLTAGMAYRSESMPSMQGLGAHQTWIDVTRRRRAAINRDLALVMADKLECRAVLRRHLGRRDALQDLQDQTQRARQRKNEARTLEKVLSTYMGERSAM